MEFIGFAKLISHLEGLRQKYVCSYLLVRTSKHSFNEKISLLRHKTRHIHFGIFRLGTGPLVSRGELPIF